MFPTSFVTALTTCWQQEGNIIRIPLKRLHSLATVVPNPRRFPLALLYCGAHSLELLRLESDCNSASTCYSDRESDLRRTLLVTLTSAFSRICCMSMRVTSANGIRAELPAEAARTSTGSSSGFPNYYLRLAHRDSVVSICLISLGSASPRAGTRTGAGSPGRDASARQIARAPETVKKVRLAWKIFATDFHDCS